jgi:outer membrane protein assembly factor BamB
MMNTFFATLLTLSSAASADKREMISVEDMSNAVVGGYDHGAGLAHARAFADVLLEAAPDRYGEKHTPLWVGIIDPNTLGLVEQKPDNFMIYWDAEDYVMTAQGCNIYRDMPALSALNRLSEITGETKYGDAVAAYLAFFLEECPSPTTGLLPSGEHMSYNTVRDRIIAKRHEMEHNPPDWELLWQVNPDAVQRAIEAVYEFHIYDKENFYYDRHGAYYTGEFDPPSVRGTYIKHSGLYAYSFLFLYSKTKDEKHLAWAHGMADLYWSRRDPETNLVPGYVSSGGVQGSTKTQLLLAYYLLEATAFEADPFFVERGLGMVDSYLKYGYDAEKVEFAQSLNIKTGEVALEPLETPWQGGESGAFYEVMALMKAYELTQEGRYLEVACARLNRVGGEPLAQDLDPYTAGCWLSLYVDAYEATQDRVHLRHARGFAAWTYKNLVKNGLILENAEGYVYHNYQRPGALLAAWLRLHAVEQREAVHWKCPDAVRADAESLQVPVRGENVNLSWTFQDGATGAKTVQAPKGTLVSIPLPKNAAQGPLEICFNESDTATVLLAGNPSGPSFYEWKHPEWITADAGLVGSVNVHDPSGVLRVECVYTWAEGQVERVPCVNEGATYLFWIPALRDKAGATLRFHIEAEGNPAWPVRSQSETRNVIVATSTGPGDVTLIEAPVSWVGRLGLPEIILSKCSMLRVKPSHPDGGTQIALKSLLDQAKLLEAWTPGIAAYKWDGAAWNEVAGAALLADGSAMKIPHTGEGPYIVAGPSRLTWKRSFNGALLSSPSLIRMDAQGTFGIVLDTGDFDGMLYALDVHGEPLWTYDVDSDQPFVTIADFDGDKIDEILLGGPVLTLLNADGSVRWKATLKDVVTPVAGDINGDGQLEVVAANTAGTIMAFSADGKTLWEATVPAGWRPLPTLGDVNADGCLDLLYGKQGHFYAFNGPDGALLWKTAVHGNVLNGAATADLDNDGKAEVVFYARTDKEATLYAVDDDGSVLWQNPVNTNSDWSPVICDFEGTSELQVLAQEINDKAYGVYSAQGERLRVLDTAGRILHTPVPYDFDGNGTLDLLAAFDLVMQARVYDNDGSVQWTYTPESRTMVGAKIKGNGTMLVADLDGDGWLDVVGGDDLTWLQLFKTDTPCPPYTVVSGQYHGDARHSGLYPVQK